MITRISKNITSFFILRGIIIEDDREVYVYSFEVLLSTFVSFVPLVVLAFVSGTTYYTTLYLMGFVPLRQVAGGYHAKSYFRCFVTLMFAYVLYLILVLFLPDIYLMLAIILSALLSVLLVLLLAPSESSNKPFSRNEAIHYKKRGRIAITAYFILAGLLIACVSDMRLALSLTLGNLTVAMSLLANFVLNSNKLRNNAGCGKGESANE